MTDTKRILNIVIVSILVIGMGIIYFLFKEEKPEKKYKKLENQYCEYAKTYLEMYKEKTNIDFSQIDKPQNLDFQTLSYLAGLEGEILPIAIVNPLLSIDGEKIYFPDSMKIRIIIKEKDNIECKGFVDIGNEPKLTLFGGEEITISLGEEYKELGYSAIDDEDGDITENVVKSDTLNLSEKGKYQVIYSVSDSDDNLVTKIRTVVIK